MNASDKLRIKHPKLYIFCCWLIPVFALIGVALILVGVLHHINECLYIGIAMLGGMAFTGLIYFVQYMVNKAKK